MHNFQLTNHKTQLAKRDNIERCRALSSTGKQFYPKAWEQGDGGDLEDAGWEEEGERLGVGLVGLGGG